MYDYQLIKDQMYEQRITNVKLGEMTGLSLETICRIRKGGNVSVANLQKVAAALNIQFCKLVQDAVAAA